MLSNKKNGIKAREKRKFVLQANRAHGIKIELFVRQNFTHRGRHRGVDHNHNQRCTCRSSIHCTQTHAFMHATATLISSMHHPPSLSIWAAVFCLSGGGNEKKIIETAFIIYILYY